MANEKVIKRIYLRPSGVLLGRKIHTTSTWPIKAL
jgi:hypothetical protein